jgi:co-chaperonin GroES (HSP10)
MLQPVEYKCVIRLMDIEETDEVLASAKRAGIQLVTQEREREQMAQIKAELVAIGGNAFEDWKGQTPAVGDQVIVAKFAGLNYEDDGVMYRIINDKDIAAVIA